MLGASLTLVLIAYLSVEFLLQSSYRNLALGEYVEAVEAAEHAERIACYIYPAASRHYQDIFLYDVKVWPKLGILGVSYGNGPGNTTLEKAYQFKEKCKSLNREKMARIEVEIN